MEPGSRHSPFTMGQLRGYKRNPLYNLGRAVRIVDYLFIPRPLRTYLRFCSPRPTKTTSSSFFSSRDETLEALGDANTVAPATRTADLHSQSHRNSYLYVFDYQTKFGDYPQVGSRDFATKMPTRENRVRGSNKVFG